MIQTPVNIACWGGKADPGEPHWQPGLSSRGDWCTEGITRGRIVSRCDGGLSPPAVYVYIPLLTPWGRAGISPSRLLQRAESAYYDPYLEPLSLPQRCCPDSLLLLSGCLLMLSAVFFPSVCESSAKFCCSPTPSASRFFHSINLKFGTWLFYILVGNSASPRTTRERRSGGMQRDTSISKHQGRRYPETLR